MSGYYADADIKCPFYTKGASGYIQCEGFDNASAVKLLFSSKKDGHPLKEDKDDYSDRYCCFNYEECPLYKIILTKYKEEK